MVIIIGLVGLLTLDRNICGDVVRSGIGGSVFYISRALDVLGSSCSVLTAVGRGFPLTRFVGGCRYQSLVINHYGWDNLVFENIYGEGGRNQLVRNYGYKFMLGDILEHFCIDKPDVLGLVPVIGEVLPEDVVVLSSYFDVAVDPQGLVRVVSSGRVVGMPINPYYLGSCKIIKVSSDELMYLFNDLSDLISFLDNFEGIFIVTLGCRGSIIIFGGELIHIPTISIEDPVDTTGAGDVYFAGILHGYDQDMDIVDAGVMATSLSYALIKYGVEDINRYDSFIDVISRDVSGYSIDRIGLILGLYG